MDQSHKKTLLIISQVYVPDPAAVGQQLADVAAEMASRGWRVVVLTSRRGYDDPSVRYPPRETMRGVEVIRLPLSSFGKRSIFVRLIGGVLFLLQAFVRGLFMARLGALFISTSPPMCPPLAAMLGLLRRVPVVYWAMDINPDQIILLGRVKKGSLAARAFDLFNRIILSRAAAVVTLDRFMADRLNAKYDMGERLHVIPPWAHEEHLEPVSHAGNPFRAAHGLEGKFVLMYSGNMSIASPLTTLLGAAARLKDDSRIVFMFIGGGLGRKEVEQAIDRDGLTNVRLLPYQPMEQLKYSLSAADVHLVSLGDEMVGVIHPCKVYGAMAVARPVLVLGPSSSHLAELVETQGIGWRVGHGDVAGVEALVRRLASMSPGELEAMGERARRSLAERFSQAALRGRVADVIERVAGEVG